MESKERHLVTILFLFAHRDSIMEGRANRLLAEQGNYWGGKRFVESTLLEIFDEFVYLGNMIQVEGRLIGRRSNFEKSESPNPTRTRAAFRKFRDIFSLKIFEQFVLPVNSKTWSLRECRVAPWLLMMVR
ncbi:jg10044 [Pararge aegeria aegeria]|uniref:Jg10044 protein n=1 Tax=Pararge aegeria aegeria TaxID=348720 RepID=A0A8S4SDN6_9NEOP|nr:jg10044 [Pararge aegeria aegeria]